MSIKRRCVAHGIRVINNNNNIDCPPGNLPRAIGGSSPMPVIDYGESQMLSERCLQELVLKFSKVMNLNVSMKRVNPFAFSRQNKIP